MCGGGVRMEVEFWTMIATAGAAAAGVLTAIIIWTQARLLVVQNQINALIQLQGQWESERMRSQRSRWARRPEDLLTLEPILEFLEEFAGFKKRGILTDDLIWDTTVGWHAARYYFYNLENIKNLRRKWEDCTLFRNLEKDLWPAYLKNEICQRSNTNRLTIAEEFERTKPHFLKGEETCADSKVSASSD